MKHQSRVAVFVHLTWATWDRLPLLTEAITPALQRALSATCAELQTDLVAVGGVEDHVHLLIRLPTVLSLAELIQQLKGSSSHLITHQIAPGAFFKWQGGYAAYSVSPRHLTQVRKYIANQRQHHLAGSLLPNLEPDADHFPTPQ